MIGDTFDDMPQVGMWVEFGQFGRPDQAVDGSGSFTAGVTTRANIFCGNEQPCICNRLFADTGES